MMTTDLNIRNFKGLKDVTLDNISRSTLIVGGNNTGKSSILEAIFLLFAPPHPQAFVKLNDFRGRKQIGNAYDLWENLIGSNGGGFEISARLDNGESAELSALKTVAEDTLQLSMPLSGTGLLSEPESALSYTRKQGGAKQEGRYYVAGGSVHH